MSTIIVVRKSMTYADGYPIKLVAGRLALDFLNTADWSEDGAVVREFISGADDVRAWMAKAVPERVPVPEDIGALHTLRAALRALLTGGDGTEAISLINRLLHDMPAETLRIEGGQVLSGSATTLPQFVAASALAILTDPREVERVKCCPGDACGWLFLDETRNARRRWCMMETCGNRAKARRNYARRKQVGD